MDTRTAAEIAFAARCKVAVKEMEKFRYIIQTWAEEDFVRARLLEDAGGRPCLTSVKEREVRYYVNLWDNQLKIWHRELGADAVAYALVVLDLTQVGK